MTIDAGPGRFKDYARALNAAEPDLMGLPLTSFALGAMAAVLDELAADLPSWHAGEDAGALNAGARKRRIDELADVLEDLLHGPMGDEIRRVAELFGQIPADG